MTPAEPAVRRERHHVERRAAAYVPSLLRPWPDRKPPDTRADARDALRLQRRITTSTQGDHGP